MLYRPQSEYGKKFRFNYVNVTILVAKLLEPFVMRQVKSVVGIAGRMLLKRGVRFFRGPIQVVCRQIFKWSGVVVTKEVVLAGLGILVNLLCAVIAGMVSYWLFLPMATHLKNARLADELNGDTSVFNEV